MDNAAMASSGPRPHGRLARRGLGPIHYRLAVGLLVVLAIICKYFEKW